MAEQFGATKGNLNFKAFHVPRTCGKRGLNWPLVCAHSSKSKNQFTKYKNVFTKPWGNRDQTVRIFLVLVYQSRQWGETVRRTCGESIRAKLHRTVTRPSEKRVLATLTNHTTLKSSNPNLDGKAAPVSSLHISRPCYRLVWKYYPHRLFPHMAHWLLPRKRGTI